MVGTVKWGVYWKYLRAALPVVLIVSLAVFFGMVQGTWTRNTAAAIMLKASTRWLAIRGDSLSNFLVTSVSAGALFATQSPALAGMSLTFAAESLEVCQYGIRMASETESHMTSVERVLNYTNIEPEPGYSNETLPAESWPTVGSLTLQDLSLAYLKEAPPVLKNISVNVADKEKVGIAGRTGAGKSSLVAALFPNARTSRKSCDSFAA
ncbi:hypothetical protein OS493_028641 [Desmophyllum pertusum]|uniref:ABC transporter domain-containing protein n=1 Tax=Desmophyllum pertusum TaxID=174260 RepID=A0A9W9YKG5_9CNID|nr:hypothetical protein OS493_028641 [Desmophyllum pertusum]